MDYVKRGEGWWKSNKENVEGHQAIHDSLVKQKQKMTSINYVPDQLPETSRRHRGSCRCQDFIVRTTRGRQPSALARFQQMLQGKDKKPSRRTLKGSIVGGTERVRDFFLLWHLRAIASGQSFPSPYPHHVILRKPVA